MKYDYTWNHLLLLAKICGRVDDSDSVTASWIEITEEHNRQTFPFTLWPLTYRTCEVTTSPAMCSPIHIKTADYTVKMYKCNEVIIICIQDGFEESPRQSICDHPCLADVDTDDEADENSTGSITESDNHVDHHSLSKRDPLLPCHVAHRYHRMKTGVNDVFYDIQENVQCVICIGHGAAAEVASCLAADMGRTYVAEMEFLGLDTPRVCVDFVGFSDAVVASRAYWDENGSCIDQYISVVFESCAAATTSDKKLVANPRSTRVTIDTLPTTLLTNTSSISRSMSFFKIRKGKKEKQPVDNPKNNPFRHISDYISALNKKINLPMNPGCETKT